MAARAAVRGGTAGGRDDASPPGGPAEGPVGGAVGRAPGRRRVATGGPPAGADAVPDPSSDGLAGRNEVVLVGRVSGAPQERELPSGDVLVGWRVVVDRPPGGRKPPEGVRPVSVDTIDCTAWTAGVRRTALGLGAGDLVQVTGSLRRRFWRAGAAAASRTEVEASAVRRLRRA